MTPFEQKLTQLLEPSLVGMGYDLVRVQMRGDTRKTLQIMAERQDNRGMTLNDCQKISETVSALMDVHDPIKERYALEVSSPGIDRPLTKAEDYNRFKGFEAKIDLKELYEGRRILTGFLVSSDGTDFTIANETGDTFTGPLDLVQRAKLLLTDDLIKAHKEQQEKFETIDQNPVSVETDTTEE